MLRPTLTVFGRTISAFHFWGLVGFTAAVAAALVLGARLGLSLTLFALLAAAAAGAFVGLALLTRAMLGEERLVYYHHEAAVLLLSAILLHALGRPVLRYLDVVGIALGLFLACGRVGCWMVGCCHGRPHASGLRYRAEHAEAGFSQAFVGVPLVPVQAVESLAVLSLTAVAIVRVESGSAAGATLSMQLVCYSVVRVFLELARGDRGRPEWGGLSEAQWLSVAIAMAVAGAEQAGWLPSSTWHVLAAASLAIAAGGIAVVRQRRGQLYRLLTPSHVEEVARALVAGAAVPRPAAPPVRVYATSLGVCLSSCAVADAAGEARIYTLSGVDTAAARLLSSLILQLHPSKGHRELVERRPGLFQLVVTTSGFPQKRPRMN
jgi:hypothetical protein